MNDDSTQKAVYKDEKTQKLLNKPLKDPTGVNPEDRKFLELVISYVNEGKIDLLKPESIINHKVYDALSEEAKGRADIEALNMLSVLRDIKALYDSGDKDSFQIQNMVERMRLTKERIEKEAGDIFII